ncbi:MAG TPA: hypothetical protein VJ461_00910 [Candidatus Nanoarchaeia archaeon]|nr:hypothetical protein [Candidatus Nanoarchaeia archaeon]
MSKRKAFIQENNRKTGGIKGSGACSLRDKKSKLRRIKKINRRSRIICYYTMFIDIINKNSWYFKLALADRADSF